jgi:hypothetical protein
MLEHLDPVVAELVSVIQQLDSARHEAGRLLAAYLLDAPPGQLQSPLPPPPAGAVADPPPCPAGGL